MRRSWWRGGGPVALLTALCVVVYCGFGLLRHYTFHSTAYDLGFFDQLTNNLSNGRGWSSSFTSYDFRGQHWEPILLVWSLLYRLAATPLWLLLVNGLALALAPLAAWRLARAWLGGGHSGALFAAVATALSPLVLGAAGFDYHSEALTPAAALFALEAAHRRRWLVTAVCCAVLLMVKEDAFLVVAGIGWLIFVVERRRAGLLLSAAAVAGFVLVVIIYMPAVRDGQGGDLVARYAYLSGGGHVTAANIVLGVVTHPGAWAGHLVQRSPLLGLAAALMPLALLPLFSGWALLAPLPPLLVALLSSDGTQASLHLHYGVEAFPLLLACAILGWRRLEASELGRSRILARAAAVMGVAAIIGGVPLAIDLHGRLADASGWDRHEAVAAALRSVPAGVAVAASTHLVPQLSERLVVTELPDVRGASWVVVDEATSPSLQAIDAGYWQMVQRLPSQFHVVASGGGVTVWERS